MDQPLASDRDRDQAGRARNARSRDDLGRPLDRVDGAPPVVTGPPALPPAEALRAGQRLLDAGRPFTAHEVFEAVWKDTDAADRELWRGLAQIAVGITHSLRGNESGAMTLLTRGADNLAGFAGTTPFEIDIDGIRSWAQEAADDLSLTARPPRLVLESS